MKKRLLFVDDEPNVLNALRRMLRGMREEWDMTFVGGGEEALDVLSREKYDVIVSDIRMPKMDGVQLLTEVRNLYPHTIRIALSGQSEQAVVLRSVGPTHQFLAKPCDADTLKAVINQSCSLRDLLASESLKRIVTRLDSIPSLPSLYLEIVEELKSPMSSLAKIGKIISKDIGMTAKVLQLVNSAYFGLPQHISSPSQAVTLLGIDTIKALVFSTHIFSSFKQSNIKHLDIEMLWKHSMITSVLAKEIAKADKLSARLTDETFMAGLLHDIGILILAGNLPEEYEKVITLISRDNFSLIEAEITVYSATHAEVGGYLLGVWGLPDSIVEAVCYHHNPRGCPNLEFSPLTTVHVANALESNRPDINELKVVSTVDIDYLENLGIKGRLPIWQKIRAEIDKRGENSD